MFTRWCLLLLVGLFISHAVALDRARYEEMVEQIEDVVEDGEERNAFIDAVGEYIEERDDALLDLVELIKLSEGERENEWHSVISRICGIPELADVDGQGAGSGCAPAHRLRGRRGARVDRR